MAFSGSHFRCFWGSIRSWSTRIISTSLASGIAHDALQTQVLGPAAALAIVEGGAQGVHFGLFLTLLQRLAPGVEHVLSAREAAGRKPGTGKPGKIIRKVGEVDWARHENSQ